MKVKDIAFIGIAVALLVIAGKLLFMMSKLLPIPASRVIVTAPVFSFVIAAAVYYTRKIGTVSFISIVYGLFMLRVSPFSALAVSLSGVFADIATIIVFRNYNTDNKIVFSVPLRSAFSVLTSYFIVTFLSKNPSFMLGGIIATAVTFVIVYFIALIGSFACVKILRSRLGDISGNNTF